MKILEEDLVNRRVEYRLIRIITLNQEYLGPYIWTIPTRAPTCGLGTLGSCYNTDQTILHSTIH